MRGDMNLRSRPPRGDVVVEPPALTHTCGPRASDRWLVADRRSVEAWLLPRRVDADLPEKTQAV